MAVYTHIRTDNQPVGSDHNHRARAGKQAYTSSTCCASGQASKLSADDVLEHLFVEAQIGNDLPQLAILVLDLFSRRISVGSKPSYLRFQLK